MLDPKPTVTVCLCSYNGARFIARAIESVLGQTFTDLELLVVDDASSDETCATVNDYTDPRVRLVRNDKNLGNARNRSRAVRLARGKLIKFVDQDDWIAPTCVAEHKRVFDAHPSVGLSFSPRTLAFEDETSDLAREWRASYGDLHLPFGGLDQVNSGGALLDRYLTSGFPENWIGEPTCVMLRREILTRSFLFNRFLLQLLDVDLWIRVIAVSDVGFLEGKLATRWVGSSNQTSANISEHRRWLDTLWLLEGLREVPDLWRRYPELATRERTEQKSAIVSLVTGRYRRKLGDASEDAARYAAHRLKRSIGLSATVFDRIDQRDTNLVFRGSP
jgi:glycosyltransferase involved in cell wall biosynthesis